MHIKKKINDFLKTDILTVLVVAFVFRLILASFGTLTLDQGTFISWSNNLAQGGFSLFYQGWSDYLPGYLYILYFLGKISPALPISQTVLYKLPAIVADILAGLAIYRIVSNKKSEKLALVSACLYLFNPAIFANSALWGQVDGLTSLAVLLTFIFVDTNPWISSIALAIGTLVKPQAAFVAPVILIWMIVQKWDYKKIVKYITLSFSVFVLGFVPFSNGENIVEFIINRLSVSSGQYPYTSVNAFNFWSIFGFWKPDTTGVVSSQAVGFIIAAIVAGLFLLKSKDKNKWSWVYAGAAIFLSTTFIFMTRMHERHFLPALAPLAVLFSVNAIYLLPYVIISVVYCANLYYSYFWITNNFASPFSDLVIKLFSILAVVTVLLQLFIDRYGFKAANMYSQLKLLLSKYRKNKNKKDVFKLPEIPAKKAKLIIFGIVVFAFITRVAWLPEPSHEYFDEVYHAFTARVMLHGDPKAWEWWNTPPEGFAYEWTHPPVAKLVMVGGMMLFGENSFGWRIPGALLGTATVFLIYLLGLKIFNNRLSSLVAAAIFALDGLPLVSSRIGMNDTYFLFFALLSLLLFFNDKIFISSIALGLAAASKWSTLWAIPIFVVAHFALKKKFRVSYLWFLVIPPLVYIASYLPMFTTGHGWDIFVGVQKQMWWYHTNLRATHPYTSPWWSWPLLLRPVWLFTNTQNGNVANIYAMGNPIVFWTGLVSVAVTFFYSFIERNKKLALIVFSYLIFFVPWAVSPRIMFFYHYLPSVPFLALATGYVITRNFKRPWLFIVLIGVFFFYFYPHWTGLYVPQQVDQSYYWFDSWR